MRTRVLQKNHRTLRQELLPNNQAILEDQGITETEYLCLNFGKMNVEYSKFVAMHWITKKGGLIEKKSAILRLL